MPHWLIIVLVVIGTLALGVIGLALTLALFWLLVLAGFYVCVGIGALWTAFWDGSAGKGLVYGLDAVGELWNHLRKWRLSRQAIWRRKRGIRGLLGRRAFRLLSTGWLADRERAWWVWVHDPDDEGWAVLSASRWRVPERVVEAAVAARLSDDEWTALFAFAERQESLADPAIRACLYVLAGRQDQWRAADPDVGLLAEAYARLEKDVRSVLRRALADEGELDALRRLVGAAGTESGPLEMPLAEQRYLTRRFSRRRDWAGLWQLARELPLLTAVEMTQATDRRWRPESRPEQELFGLLRAADAGALRRGLRTLSSQTVIPTLATRPQAAWRHDDLGAAVAAAAQLQDHQPTRPLRELLIGCLEHRFGGDIGLGDGIGIGDGVARPGADEIAIAREEPGT